MSQNIMLIIDATGDEVVITGKKDVMTRVMDLSLLRYVEIDGIIQAEMFDPVPERGAVIANHAIRAVRRAG